MLKKHRKDFSWTLKIVNELLIKEIKDKVISVS